MFKPNDYESAQAFNGASEALTPGGHKCIILDAREQKSRAGNPMLVLSFDIAPGDDFAGYFKQKYQSAKHFRDDAKWPNAGIYRQLVTKKDGTTDEFFKGMITAIEESNPGFKFNFDEKTLKGKFFGGVFGREQFQANDGSLKWSTKCQTVNGFMVREMELKPCAFPTPSFANSLRESCGKWCMRSGEKTQNLPMVTYGAPTVE